MSSGNAFLSVATLTYLDLAAPPTVPEVPQEQNLPAPSVNEDLFTAEQVSGRVNAALADAEQRWNAQAREEQHRRSLSLAAVLESFAQQRGAYMKHLEREVVQLSLAIAKKILQRESELDPTLLLGLVRLSLDQLGVRSPVTIRLSPERHADWSAALHARSLGHRFELVADGKLAPDDCLVETESGHANFGFSAQFKSIEQSFAELLSRRPTCS